MTSPGAPIGNGRPKKPVSPEIQAKRAEAKTKRVEERKTRQAAKAAGQPLPGGIRQAVGKAVRRGAQGRGGIGQAVNEAVRSATGGADSKAKAPAVRKVVNQAVRRAASGKVGVGRAVNQAVRRVTNLSEGKPAIPGGREKVGGANRPNRPAPGAGARRPDDRVVRPARPAAGRLGRPARRPGPGRRAI